MILASINWIEVFFILFFIFLIIATGPCLSHRNQRVAFEYKPSRITSSLSHLHLRQQQQKKIIKYNLFYLRFLERSSTWHEKKLSFFSPIILKENCHHTWPLGWFSILGRSVPDKIIVKPDSGVGGLKIKRDHLSFCLVWFSSPHQHISATIAYLSQTPIRAHSFPSHRAVVNFNLILTSFTLVAPAHLKHSATCHSGIDLEYFFESSAFHTSSASFDVYFRALGNTLSPLPFTTSLVWKLR